MAIIVVGGHSRSIGKTSVAAGVISAFSELDWTALKITQYGHGICSRDGEPCGCAPREHPFAIEEEQSRTSGTDSARFLAAGARRAYWVRARAGQLDQAMPALLPLIRSSRFAIIESNSILRFLQPDLYLPVMSFGVADFKASAREFLERASAFVVVGAAAGPAWPEIDASLLEDIPRFAVQPPAWISAELQEFIAERIAA